MRQSARQGDNRTGTMVAPELAEEMVAATREFPPSSPGDGRAIAQVRIAYAQAGEGLGETPPPSTLKDTAKAAASAVTGGQPTLLMDIERPDAAPVVVTPSQVPSYRSRLQARIEALRSFCARHGCPYVLLTPDMPFTGVLASLEGAGIFAALA